MIKIASLFARPEIWHVLVATGLGQRFLVSQMAKASQEASEQSSPRAPASGITSPRITSGHPEGEGVRNFASLVAEAVAEAGRRSTNSSVHGRRAFSPARQAYLPPLLAKVMGWGTDRVASCSSASCRLNMRRYRHEASALNSYEQPTRHALKSSSMLGQGLCPRDAAAI